MLVLNWRAAWFRVLWREALDLYLVALVAHVLRPCAATYAIHFAWLRPAQGTQLSISYYSRFFRYLRCGHRHERSSPSRGGCGAEPVPPRGCAVHAWWPDVTLRREGLRCSRGAAL